MTILYIIIGTYVCLGIILIILPYLTDRYNPELKNNVENLTINLIPSAYSIGKNEKNLTLKIIGGIFLSLGMLLVVILTPLILLIGISKIKKTDGPFTPKKIKSNIETTSSQEGIRFVSLKKQKKDFEAKLSKIYVSKDTPGMHYTDIIYLDDNKNSSICQFFKKNAKEVARLFAKKNYRFIYFPHIVDFIKTNSLDVILQNYPFLKKSDILNSFTNSEELQSSIIKQFDFMEYFLNYEDETYTHNLITSPDCKDYCLNSFIQYQKNTDKEYEEKANNFTDFIKTEIDDESNVEYPAMRDKNGYGSTFYSSFRINAADEEIAIWKQIHTYISFLEKPLTTFRYTETNPSFRETRISHELLEIAHFLWKNIQHNFEQLQKMGIHESMLKDFVSTPNMQLSRLFITKDYRIFLPDYDNKEIKLTPLPKAVFFLFLKHPEGILFKYLPDYKDELLAIYKTISKRDSLSNMNKSILDLTDPTKNSINEKCSRIKEAFTSAIEDSIVENYYITGDKAEPKKILLDRRLVVLEANF